MLNKKKLKKYEKEMILNYFINNNMQITCYIYYDKKINIFKKYKFVLTLLYY
jgi:hypothetical protein